MTLKGFFIRFTLCYIGVSVLIATGFYVFGLKGNSGVNIAALLSSVLWACMSFANKNQRYFTPQEKKQAVIGMVLIDLCIQFIGVLLVLAGTGGAMPVGVAAIAFVVVGAIHALTIYVFVGIGGRQFAKQLERQARTQQEGGS